MRDAARLCDARSLLRRATGEIIAASVATSTFLRELKDLQTLVATDRNVAIPVNKDVIKMSVRPGTSPNAVVFNGRIYLFYYDNGSNGSGYNGICYTYTTSNDASAWSQTTQVAPNMTNQPGTSATAVVVADRLFLFYTSGDGTLWFTRTNDGTSWSPLTPLAAGTTSSLSVASGTTAWATMFGSLPYLFWQGSAPNGIDYAPGASYDFVQELDTIMQTIATSGEFFIDTNDSDIISYLTQVFQTQPQPYESIELDLDGNGSGTGVLPAVMSQAEARHRLGEHGGGGIANRAVSATKFVAAVGYAMLKQCDVKITIPAGSAPFRLYVKTPL